MEFPLKYLITGIILFTASTVLLVLFRFFIRNTAAVRFSSLRHTKFFARSLRVRLLNLPFFLRLGALALLCLAFARPRIGNEIVETQTSGIAIQMVVDRSGSMEQPMKFGGWELSRLDVVKKVFEEFVSGSSGGLSGRPTDLIGLTSFAAFVREECPLTLEHTDVVEMVKGLSLAERHEDGTAVGDAIYRAALNLISAEELITEARKAGENYKINSKIIILLTDGQQNAGDKWPREAAEFCAESDIKLYTVAVVGLPEKSGGIFGSLFPMRKLDTRPIEQAALMTGGQFGKATDGESLREIYERIDSLEKSPITRSHVYYSEHFQPLVMLGFFLVVLEMLLSSTVLRRMP